MVGQTARRFRDNARKSSSSTKASITPHRIVFRHVVVKELGEQNFLACGPHPRLDPELPFEIGPMSGR
jgi:hypothetical protein